MARGPATPKRSGRLARPRRRESEAAARDDRPQTEVEPDANRGAGWWLAHAAVDEQEAAQHPGELAELVEWLERRPAAARVLEIGVYLAGTAWLWHHLWPRARLVGVDLAEPPCPECETRRAHRQCPRDRARLAGMTLVLGDSSSPLTRAGVQAALGGPVDFLHIDGGHEYEQVRSDFELYAPLVAAGGAVALHDSASEAYPGAVRFWRELAAQHPAAFLIHEPGLDWSGIGVVPLVKAREELRTGINGSIKTTRELLAHHGDRAPGGHGTQRKA